MSISGSPPRARAGRPSRNRFSVLRLQRSGTAPVRVLLVGDRGDLWPAGVGIGGLLVDRLAARTPTGVDLDVLWGLDPALDAIRQGLSSWRLWPYDAVVVLDRLAAVDDGPGSHRRTSSRRGLLEELARTTPVLLVQPPQRGRRITARPATDVDPALVHVVPADGAAGAAGLASLVSGLLPPLIAAGTVRRLPVPEPPPGGEDGARRRAVHALDVGEQPVDRHLDRIVRMAQEAFETSIAAVNLVDGHELWTIAAAGAAPGRTPLWLTLCGRAVQRPTMTVIPDTWLEPGLDDDPVAHGPDPVRFYASYPLESADGHRIGTLCVHDPHPQDVRDLDFAILRDLALLAEGEIIEASQREVGAPSARGFAGHRSA